MYVSHFLSAIAAAAFLILGLPPVSIYASAWLGWCPLFFILYSPKCRSLPLFFNTYLTGFLYFLVALKWLYHLGWPVYLFSVAGCALIFPVFFLFMHATRLVLENDLAVTFAGSIFWGVLMFAARVIPAGVLLFELPFYGPAEFHQFSALGAFWLLPALILAFSSSLAMYLHERTVGRFFLIAILAGSMTSLYFWGKNRIESMPAREPMKIALLQHNLPVYEAWTREQTEEVKSAYREYAQMAARMDPNLIIFPLYNLPEAEKDKTWINAQAVQARRPVLLSFPLKEKKDQNGPPAGKHYAAVLLSPENGPSATLTSDSEMTNFFVRPSMPHHERIMETKIGRFGIMFPWEETSPQAAHLLKEQKALFILVLDDSREYSKTILPALLLAQDQLRAIETGLPVLRVSSYGYTAFIDRTGRIVKKSETGQADILMI